MPERKTLAEIEHEARELMALHGLEGWRFQWMNSKTIFGTCTERFKLIRLSKPRAAHESWEDTRDTILHEIAHAIAGAQADHGYEWRVAAKRIGARPDATQAERPDGLRAATAPWVGRCPNGHTSPHRFFRKPKLAYSCSTCSPSWAAEYLLTYTREDAS